MFITHGSTIRTPEQTGRARVRVSLCMIVRDNEATIVPCLESIRPWVDEMLVVDTGSRDRTPQIARDLGAAVFHFPWCDDFSAARNESLRRACGHWLFWMDSDDTIDAENGRRLRGLAYGPHEPDTLGYVMQVRCPPCEGGPDEFSVVDQVKMFPNHPELRFEFRIHEQILPSIRRLGGKIGWSDVFVVHSGSDASPEGRSKKYDRDLKLLGLELAERPNHAFVLFNFGMTYEDMGAYQQASSYLRQCLAASAPDDSHVRKAYALLMNCYVRMERWDDARRMCDEGRCRFPQDAELAFRHGMLAHKMGELACAEQAYRVAIGNGDARHFASLDRGVAGFKARHNLALVYREMGRPDLAELECRQAACESPRYDPTRRLLVELLFEQQKIAAAEIEIERMDEFDSFSCDALMLRADLAERRGDLEKTRALLEEARARFPETSAALDRHCRFLCYHATDDEAERALLELVQRESLDAGARYNLGSLYRATGQFEEAKKWLRESLRLRRDSAPTWVALGETLAALGELDEAIVAFHEAVGIAPDDVAARDRLQGLSDRVCEETIASS